MMVSLEIIEQGSAHIDDVKAFWLTEMNAIVKKLTGKDIDDTLFYEQDHFYVLRFNGQIGCVMTSSWQSTRQLSTADAYYKAWPDAIEFLKLVKQKSFLKMGMIISKRDVVPLNFHNLAPIVVGCGIKYSLTHLNVDGIVSFPRTDNAVYKACFDWGAMPIQSNLEMYNTPVTFVFMTKHSYRDHHDIGVLNAVNDLWRRRIESPALISQVA